MCHLTSAHKYNKPKKIIRLLLIVSQLAQSFPSFIFLILYLNKCIFNIEFFPETFQYFVKDCSGNVLYGLILRSKQKIRDIVVRTEVGIKISSEMLKKAEIFCDRCGKWGIISILYFSPHSGSLKN